MNLADELRDLVAPEPPYLLDPDAAIAGGRRRRRARTTAATAAVGVTATVVVGAVVALQPAAPVVRDTVTSRTFGSTAPQGEIEQLVRAHTPDGWTLANVHESAADGFQADVDDGQGASRVYVGISPSPGTLQQHPCQDQEFALGGFCREVELDADTRLITRGPTASGPVTSSYAVIVHRDGSGVDVGNDNATWPRLDLGPGSVVTPEQKRLMNRPDVNRPAPVYSLAQLVDIAKAVDAATSAR